MVMDGIRMVRPAGRLAGWSDGPVTVAVAVAVVRGNKGREVGRGV